jgi:short-subunit dehydrogenase
MARIELGEKKVLLTGGSRGLGLELSKELVKRGAVVHVIARSEQPFKHPSIRYHRMDLSKQKPEFDLDFDIVISSLGTNPGNRRFDDMEYSEVMEMLEMNVALHLWLLKHIRYRKFVFVNSVLSIQGLPEYSMYCASKAFIHILNQALRREGKDTVIIYPYKINTSLFREVRDFCTLDAGYVAKRLLDDIERGVKEDYIPCFFALIGRVAAVIPSFMQDLLARLVRRIFYARRHKEE